MTRTTTSLTRRARVLGAGAALLLGVGALAGCSAHPGQAAIVNYTDVDGVPQTFTVSEQEVQDATQELAEYTAATGEEGPTAAYVLNALVSLPVVDQLGADFGVIVTDADALSALQERTGADIDYSPAAIDVFRYVMLVSQINALEDQAAVSVELQELQEGLSVEASPRYQGGGAWLLQDDTQLELG